MILGSKTGDYPSDYPLWHPKNWGRELNPNIFFSNFSGASGISRENPGISRQKSLIFRVSRDIPNFSAPTPSRGRPPPNQKISGLKSLGLGSSFVASQEAGPKQTVQFAIPPFVVENPLNKDYPGDHPQNSVFGRVRGSGGVKSTGVSQSVRETSRDESQNVLSTQKLFKTRDLELPIF